MAVSGTTGNTVREATLSSPRIPHLSLSPRWASENLTSPISVSPPLPSDGVFPGLTLTQPSRFLL